MPLQRPSELQAAVVRARHQTLPRGTGHVQRQPHCIRLVLTQRDYDVASEASTVQPQDVAGQLWRPRNPSQSTNMKSPVQVAMQQGRGNDEPTRTLELSPRMSATPIEAGASGITPIVSLLVVQKGPVRVG